MEPVNNVSQVMQILRRQMSENLEKLRQTGKLADAEAAVLGPSGRRTEISSRQALTRKIKSISADDPRFLHKAANVFVVSVLLSEFGEGMVNDPGFRDLVDQVEAAMTSDADIERDLRQLVQELRAER
jgi:hypothetical protein